MQANELIVSTMVFEQLVASASIICIVRKQRYRMCRVLKTALNDMTQQEAGTYVIECRVQANSILVDDDSPNDALQMGVYS